MKNRRNNSHQTWNPGVTNWNDGKDFIERVHVGDQDGSETIVCSTLKQQHAMGAIFSFL